MRECGVCMERVVEKGELLGFECIMYIYYLELTYNLLLTTVQCIECFFTVNPSTHCIVYY